MLDSTSAPWKQHTQFDETPAPSETQPPMDRCAHEVVLQFSLRAAGQDGVAHYACHVRAVGRNGRQGTEGTSSSGQTQWLGQRRAGASECHRQGSAHSSVGHINPGG